MHFAAASHTFAHRRITRADAGLCALAGVATTATTMQGVVAPPPRSPGPGRP